MFGRPTTTLSERIRRAAQLVRAFAFLEGAGDRQPLSPAFLEAGGRQSLSTEAMRVDAIAEAGGISEPNEIAKPAGWAAPLNGSHPHSARLVREPRRRRPGTTKPRPALCLTPVTPQPAGPLRRELTPPRRLQSHRAGPHHS